MKLVWNSLSKQVEKKKDEDPRLKFFKRSGSNIRMSLTLAAMKDTLPSSTR